MAPQLYLVYLSFRKTNGTGEVFLPGLSLHSYELAFKKHIPSIFNTFRLGIVSVVLVIIIAVLVAYIVVRRPSIKSRTIDTLSMVPYIIPGSVVGISLIMAFNTQPLILTGTMTILIVAMLIRRIPYTIRSSVAILGQIPISVEEAARSLGTTEMGAFWKITFPMMSNGVISGGLLSWVTIITEMSSSIMLYSARSITLTVATYVYVSRGADGPAAALATVLMILTFLSLLIFMKVSKNKDVSM
jgi:iron(III) transport system permease protein